MFEDSIHLTIKKEEKLTNLKMNADDVERERKMRQAARTILDTVARKMAVSEAMVLAGYSLKDAKNRTLQQRVRRLNIKKQNEKSDEKVAVKQPSIKGSHLNTTMKEAVNIGWKVILFLNEHKQSYTLFAHFFIIES